MQLQLHYTNYTTQLQLYYTTTTSTAALHHTTSSSCGWCDRPGDHCNHCNHSKKHNSNHLSVHQWIRSAIRDSQEPTPPIGFLFLKLPPPPCAVLLVYYMWVCLKMVRIPSKMTIFMEKIWWSSQVGDHICFQCRKDGNLFSTRRLGDVSYTKNCMGKKRLSYFRCFQSNAGESFFPAPFPEDALSHHYFSIFFVIIISLLKWLLRGASPILRPISSMTGNTIPL